MDRLWSPWRLAYVTAAQTPPTACIFCDAAAQAGAELVLYRGRYCFVILNLYLVRDVRDYSTRPSVAPAFCFVLAGPIRP